MANGGALRFDTVDYDSDGFVPGTSPFDWLSIPAGLDGLYLLTAESLTVGNQGTTIGMGIAINGIRNGEKGKRPPPEAGK